MKNKCYLSRNTATVALISTLKLSTTVLDAIGAKVRKGGEGFRCKKRSSSRTLTLDDRQIRSKDGRVQEGRCRPTDQVTGYEWAAI